MDGIPSRASLDVIERRLGATAAAEWQSVLTDLSLSSGFSLIIVLSSGRTAADLCRESLQIWIDSQGKRLTVLNADTPQALIHAVDTLFTLPDDPDRGAIWFCGLPPPIGAERELWWPAWRRVAATMNFHRETLRRVSVPVLLVGPEEMASFLREVSPDLWSIRAMTAHVLGAAPMQGTDTGSRDDRHNAMSSQPPPIRRSDSVYDHARRMVSRLRGKPGQEVSLARHLDVVGEAHAATGDWRAAEAAWSEAAELLSEFGTATDQLRLWLQLGDARRNCARLGDALDAYQRATVVAQRIAAAPGNTGWQRDLSLSLARIGDALGAQGDLTSALRSFRAALAIREHLAAADPESASLQRDLSVAHEKIGDMLRAQGDFAAALAAFRASLAIREMLSARDRNNAGWQRDLSVSREKIGDVLNAQDELPAALDAFLASLAIRRRLVAVDPGNADWQRDLSVSHEKIGSVLRARGDLAAALRAFRASLAIRETLAASDPGNATRQRDLSASHELIGDVLLDQGDLVTALGSFRTSLAIRERMASSDPGNAGWQRDFALSRLRIGRATMQHGDAEAARSHLTTGRAIVARLAAAAPDWAMLRNDLTRFDHALASLPP